MKLWLILLPLLACACGIMTIPTVSGSSTAEIPATPAKKQVQEAAFQPSQVISPVLCVSAAETLNLRVAPSTSADGLGVLYHGDRVVRIGAVPGWYKVQAGGRTGWVKAEYIGDCK